MSNPTKIVIYASETCPYCTAARMLLKKEGLAYDDILITKDASFREEMERRSGRHTVPQIFFAETHIGGFDELYALQQSGELERVLNDAQAATHA